MFVNFLTKDFKTRVSFANGNNSKREEGKRAFEKKFGTLTADNTNDTLEIFYINDLHRKFGPLFALNTAVSKFDNSNSKFKHTQFQTKEVDKLKVAAGDLVVGPDEKLNSFFFKLFSKRDEKKNPFGLGFDVMCLGNHEFDAGESGLARELDQDLSYPFVATNLTIKDSSPLARHRDSKIVKSYIKEINGTKYGFVGILPNNLNGNTKKNNRFKGIEVTGQNNPNYWEFNETLNAVRDEVAKLSEKNINRIICISHIGEENNELLAKKVDGIDIIISGHKHAKHFKKIVSNDEKVHKAPTILVQAGRNGEQYGILKVKFDKIGEIIPEEARNRRQDIDIWQNTNCERVFYDKLEPQIENRLEKSTEYVGELSEDFSPNRSKMKENPVLSLLADAIRWKALNSGNADKKTNQTDMAFLINQYDYTHFKLNKGPITRRQIQDLVTYQDRVYKVWLKGDDVIEILKWGSDSLDDNNDNKKGIVQVSGIKYKISPKGVEEISILDKENNETPFDVNQKYYVAYDTYFLKRAKADGKDKIVKILEKNDFRRRLDFNLEVALADYLREVKKGIPFAIDTDDRIIVERNQSNNPESAKKLKPKDDGYVHRQQPNGSFKGSPVGIK